VDAAHGLGVAFDHDGRSVAPLDFDGDGDLDLAVLSLQGLQLLENTSVARSFARFRLRATTTEPHALGATVTVQAGGRTQIERVRLTAGFHAQVSRELHFGLGDAEKLDVVVRWPSGATQRFVGLAAGHRYEVVEGTQTVTPRPIPAWPAEARPRAQARYTLDVPLAGLDGEPAKLGPASVPTILNFWAPWCEACVREIPVLAKVARDRGDAVRVIGVSVETKKVDEVRAFAAEHGLDYPLRAATDAAIAAFFGDSGRMTLPATFVFDASGRLRRGLFREVDAAELGATLDTLVAPASARDRSDLAAAAVRKGDAVGAVALLRDVVAAQPDSALMQWQLGMSASAAGDHPAAIAALRRARRLAPEEVGFHADLAKVYYLAGQPDRTLALLREGVRRWPDSPRCWGDLAALLEARDELKAARAAFQRALEIEPRQPELWERLAALESHLGLHREAAASRARIRPE